MNSIIITFSLVSLSVCLNIWEEKTSLQQWPNEPIRKHPTINIIEMRYLIYLKNIWQPLLHKVSQWWEKMTLLKHWGVSPVTVSRGYNLYHAVIIFLWQSYFWEKLFDVTLVQEVLLRYVPLLISSTNCTPIPNSQTHLCVLKLNI